MTNTFLLSLRIVQEITFVVILSTLCMIVSIMIIDKKNSARQVGFLLWVVHGLIYYVAFSSQSIAQMATVESGQFYTGWSAALRLHGYVTLFVIFLDVLLDLLDKRFGFTPKKLLKKILRRRT